MSKEPLTDERIAEIRGREKVASDGPWGQMMDGTVVLIMELGSMTCWQRMASLFVLLHH